MYAPLYFLLLVSDEDPQKGYNRMKSSQQELEPLNSTDK
jgi:hypothetical protein